MTFRLPLRDVEHENAWPLAGCESEASVAGEALGMGYMARALVQTTIPHRAWPHPYFQRRNGHLCLTMQGHHRHGLPYGKYPRLLLAWATRKAKLDRSPTLQLPTSQAALLRELGLRTTGGANGTLTAFHKQAIRLVKCTVHVDWDAGRGEEDKGYRLAYRTRLWWEPKHAQPKDFWIELSANFYDEIMDSAVPFDFRVMCALNSPMANDLYIWATYRVSTLSRPLLIPWPVMQNQFGADYGRLIDFRRRCTNALRDVHQHWPGLRAVSESGGLRLRPCAPHVASRVFSGWSNLSEMPR